MKVITIGRLEDNDVVINDPYATRHHLQIIRHDDGHYSLVDFGSTNGTFINGQKIRGEVDLYENDVVRIGNTTIPWRLYFEEGEHEVTEINIDSPPFDDIASIPSTPTMPIVKERHGFVTFWLWFMIAVSLIGFVNDFFSIQVKIDNGINQTYRELYEHSEYLNIDKNTLVDFRDAAHTHSNLISICSLLSVLCSIIFVVLILKWKKIGFWCWACASMVFGVINVILMNLLVKDYESLESLNLLLYVGRNPNLMLIPIPIGILILWAILQIKKNGVSCWKLLENPTRNKERRSLLNKDKQTNQEAGGGSSMNKSWSWIIIGGVIAVTTIVTFLLPHNPDKQKYGDSQESIEQQVAVPVDLGLPSGCQWSEMNLGASSCEEAGYFFGWGDTEPYTKGSRYKYVTESFYTGRQGEYQYLKYVTNSKLGNVDGKTTLEPIDDAATVMIDDSWSIPTITDIEELLKYCSWKETFRNNVEGIEFVGPNGNTIFFPDLEHYAEGLDMVMPGSWYWSQSLDMEMGDDFASAMAINHDSKGAVIEISPEYRSSGGFIRPVKH